jgi:hypothetical protein
MPEQISKYPEVTLQVLTGAGARCGEGIPPKILVKCPAERFCALPGGEICVYGITQIPQMTQITTKELAQVVCPDARQSSTALPGALECRDGGVDRGAGHRLRDWPLSITARRVKATSIPSLRSSAGCGVSGRLSSARCRTVSRYPGSRSARRREPGWASRTPGGASLRSLPGR